MNASGSQSASPFIQTQHVANQYRLQIAHLGLQKTATAALHLADGANSLLATLRSRQGGGSDPQRGTGIVGLSPGMLQASLQAAENSLRKIADESGVLDRQVLDLFPQVDNLDGHTEAAFSLTENTGNFVRNATDLLGRVKRFAQMNSLEAAGALCAIEAAGPSVSQPFMAADHSVLVQMGSLAHL